MTYELRLLCHMSRFCRAWWWASIFDVLRNRQLRCDHTCPIQNTKPLRTPKYTPKYTPNPPPKPKYRKNTKKIRKSPNFVYFSRIFSVFRFWRGIWGVFRGVFRGSAGFCILYGARMIATVTIFSSFSEEQPKMGKKLHRL